MRTGGDTFCVYARNSIYSRMQRQQKLLGKLQRQSHFLPVATPGLTREHPNLFCAYARVGEEKETQILAFWELICRAYLSSVGRRSEIVDYVKCASCEMRRACMCES